MLDTLLQEKQVEQHLIDNENEAAVNLLFDLIVQQAKAKNFSKAESLRNRLLEVDDMALSKIIRSGEIIEEEKANALDAKHMHIWSALYSTLRKEEVHALYFELKQAKYDSNVAIFEEGKSNDRLYLIDSGELKMTYRRGNEEMLLKILGRGDMAGEDTFFSITYCTTSLVTLSMVDLKFLEKESLNKLEKNHPWVGSKIQDYCLKIKQVPDLLKKKNLNRRIRERYKLKGMITFQIINKNGGGMGNNYIGSLSDISSTGLSFFIRTSKKKRIRLLLGRRINLKFSLSQNEFARKLNLDGTVVGVYNHFFNDFSVHVRFDKKIAENLFTEVNQESF